MGTREDLEKSLKELDELIQPFLKGGSLDLHSAQSESELLETLSATIGVYANKSKLSTSYAGFKMVAEQLCSRPPYFEEVDSIKNYVSDFIDGLNSLSAEFNLDDKFGKLLEAALKSIDLAFQYNGEKSNKSALHRIELMSVIEKHMKPTIDSPIAIDALSNAMKKFKEQHTMQ